MTNTTTPNDPYARREADQYHHPVPSREAIIHTLTSHKRPMSWGKLVAALGVNETMSLGFEKRLQAMLRDGQLIVNQRGAFALRKGMRIERAVVRVLKSGSVSLQFDDQALTQACTMDARQATGLMHGDKVLLRMVPGQDDASFKALLIDVEKRAHTHVVGRYRYEKGRPCLRATQRLYAGSMRLQGLPDDVKLSSNEMVLARIVQYPSKQHAMLLAFEKCLGDAPTCDVERAMIAHTFCLQDGFSDEAQAQADRLSRLGVDVDASRTDWRSLPFVTIDGEDARDFDDAIYVEPLQEGWMVYVAIADVSHYVPEDTPLDQEAQDRATSVYLPRSVIPMLPEALSNDLCSLVPEQDRLVLGLRMRLDAQCMVKEKHFCKAVIHSVARLTYTQACAIIKDAVQVFTAPSGANVAPCVHHAHQVFKQLLTKRAARGALEIELPRTKPSFDKHGVVMGFEKETRNVAHRVIEELMLLANETTASFMLEHNMLGVYRNHKKPDTKKLMELYPLFEYLGIRVPKDMRLHVKTMQKLLMDLAKTSYAESITPLVLSTMAQAEYGVNNTGHFGLAYTHYCHFTSPIRRYPDLLVHRAISYYITHGTPNVQQQKYAWEAHARFASTAERRADEASRFALQALVCAFMLPYKGRHFHATIIAVRSFGMFVKLDNIMVEGMVHLSQLGSDYFVFDAQTMSLTGRKTSFVYRIGMRVQVELLAIDETENLLDFRLVQS